MTITYDNPANYDENMVPAAGLKRLQRRRTVGQHLKDSGQRRTFTSGAVRDQGDLKPRPDLISPHANIREGMVFALGAEKYEVRNWEKGMPISECLASAQRHIEQFKRGDTDEDHLAQARWNLGAMIHYEEEIKAGRLDPILNDLPLYNQQDTIAIEQSDCIPVIAPSPTFYIAGPMRGIAYLNFPMFDRAAKRAELRGYTVFSPAESDRANGIDPGSFKESDASMQEIAKRDCSAILGLNKDRGDGLILLPGWEQSTGARAEVALALWLGLKFQLFCVHDNELSPPTLMGIDPLTIEHRLFAGA